MTGDQADFADRLRRVLPRRWFGDAAPVLDSLLAGMASTWAAVWGLLAFSRRQTRIATLDGDFLDLAAQDFRPRAFVRKQGETDTQFRARLLPIFPEKVTRAALVSRLTDLGCGTVDVFEPTRPADTGGYGVAMGYGVGGRYGSTSMPAQVLVTAARPQGQGIPNVPGYGSGGYGVAGAYATTADAAPHVTDADIYATVADTTAEGVVAWTRLTGSRVGGSGAPVGLFTVGQDAVGT